MLKSFFVALPIILPWILFAITLATFAFKAGTFKATTPTAEAVKKEVSALYEHCRIERRKINIDFKDARVECQSNYRRKLDDLGKKVECLNDTTARLDERLVAIGGIIDTFNKQIKKAEDIMRLQLEQKIRGL